MSWDNDGGQDDFPNCLGELSLVHSCSGEEMICQVHYLSLSSYHHRRCSCQGVGGVMTIALALVFSSLISINHCHPPSPAATSKGFNASTCHCYFSWLLPDCCCHCCLLSWLLSWSMWQMSHLPPMQPLSSQLYPHPDPPLMILQSIFEYWSVFVCQPSFTPLPPSQISHCPPPVLHCTTPINGGLLLFFVGRPSPTSNNMRHGGAPPPPWFSWPGRRPTQGNGLRFDTCHPHHPHCHGGGSGHTSSPTAQ